MRSFNGDFPPWRCSRRQRRRGERRRHPLGNKPWKKEILIRSMPMKPDVYVWGALLGGCRMHGNVELGEKVAHHLIDLEPHNHAFYVNWCDIYAKAGMFDAAKRIRNLMKEKRIEKKIPGCSMIEIDGEVQEFSAGGSSELPMKELVLVLNGLSNEMNI